jgi:hypothetical protein
VLLSLMPVGKRSPVSIFENIPVSRRDRQEYRTDLGDSGQQRIALTRSRLNETEALHIFSMIASGKNQCGNGMPLSKVRLKTWANYFSDQIPYGFSKPFESQTWSIDRGLRDDEFEKISAKLAWQHSPSW